MKLYNILFYYAYELALRSKNNREAPLFFTIPIVAICFMFNVFSVFLIIEGMGIARGLVFFPKETKFIGALCFLTFVSAYYLLNKKYQKIYLEYSSKSQKPIKIFKAISIIIIYYVASFGLLLVAALFKNKDWIFK